MGFDVSAWTDLLMVAFVGIFVVAFIVVVLTFGMVLLAARRGARADDPAVAELKRRLADGEISPIEYQVRLRALEEDA